MMISFIFGGYRLVAVFKEVRIGDGESEGGREEMFNLQIILVSLWCYHRSNGFCVREGIC
jgi:hypothetical protein